MEHSFGGNGFTLGIEEELMIVDGRTLDLANEIEALLSEAPSERVTPELLESVVEISTTPCRDAAAAAEELRALRGRLSDGAAPHGLRIGSAGTHPFARWERQRVVRDDRYRGLVSSLGFIARRELLFGVHVHVGIGDPETAIRVANGLRGHVPLLVALAANSPFWRGADSGLQSCRIPIFRSFPRVGIPPVFGDWDDYVRRVSFMVDTGLIDDYTYLWYDVRPHPKLGTVEVRAMDAQTRVEHTVAIAALVQALAHRIAHASAPPVDAPHEILDENRWAAARGGLDAEFVDWPSGARRRARDEAAALLDELAGNAADLGCGEELAGVRDLLDNGNGAARQRLVFEANHDAAELMAEIVAAT